MKQTLAALALIIALNTTAVEAKETKAHKVRRWVAAGVCAPMFLGVAIAYAPVVSVIACTNAWSEIFFERQHEIDAEEAAAEAKAKATQEALKHAQ